MLEQAEVDTDIGLCRCFPFDIVVTDLVAFETGRKYTATVRTCDGYEFLAEYKRWFDLVRREKVSEFKSKYYPSSLMKANSHYYFPIPSTQIKLAGWTNNAGY